MNTDEIRRDFPILGTGLVYFDNACMTLKPRQVVEAMNDYYYNYPACAGRSAHRLGKKATEEYEKAREAAAKFISAKHNEIIFTKNTTEGINLVCSALNAEGAIVTSDKEHNSNLVPWQCSGREHRIVRTNENGVDLDELEKKAAGAAIVSVVHTSNVDGTTTQLREIAKIAHDNGALVMADAAQSAPHQEIDVKKTGVDFLSFSGHKMLGPSIGVLYVKEDAADRLKTFMTGGDTVENTTYTSHVFLKPPEKFEAGLQNYAGAIGLAAAIRYLGKIGMNNTAKHEAQLNKIITESLSGTKNLEIIGPGHEKRSGIFSFNIRGMESGEVAIMLDQNKIAVRSGYHCAHSWFNGRGIKGSCRASLYLYNTEGECATFADTVKKVAGMV